MNDGSVNRSMINTATLVDLKAELLRKQEVVKQAKLQRGNSYESTSAFKFKNEIKKQNTSKLPIKVLESDVDDEEEKALVKSKAMLEQKSRIYDEISKGNKILDEEESERYLVNFDQKTSDHRTTEYYGEEEVKDYDNYAANNQPHSDNPLVEDEWVDYVDKQGKQRRCLRDDLPAFKDANSLLTDKEPLKTAAFWEKKQTQPDPPVIPTCSTANETEKEGPIHYESIRNNEIRTHGVGYFAFSENEDQRKQQMDMLNNMRDQTLKQRELRQRIAEKRSAMLSARLAKVKQRKNIADDNDESKNSSSDESSSIPLEEIPLPEVQNEKKAKTRTMRPWDKGKDFSEILKNDIDPQPSYVPQKRNLNQDWESKRRCDRQAEFAPPELYNKVPPTHRSPWKFSSPVNSNAPHETEPTHHVEGASNGSSSRESPLPIFPGNFWQQSSPVATSPCPGDGGLHPEIHMQSESNQWSNVVGSTDPSGTVLGGDNMNPEEVSRIISEGLKFFRNQVKDFPSA